MAADEIVTIDGPSGSGKSTISRMIAAKLGYTYLDTGAMYRAVGFKARQLGIDLDDAKALEKLFDDNLNLTLAPGDGDTRVFVDQQDISLEIRTAEMGLVASKVSAQPIVRQKLTEMQRNMGKKGKIVAEGRDTGTVVFPRAKYKFYLDASADERARRRSEQLRDKGEDVDEKEILAQIMKRDHNDSSRALAPLKAAEDAVVIDSTTFSIDEVVSYMLEQVAKS